MGGRSLKYNWLITEFEAYPSEEDICTKLDNEYVVLSNDELLDMLEKESESVKRELKATDLSGTYEEIYSNWKNKMYHAVDINSPYLSFDTMSSCQQFYDEMADEFDISRIELLANYNPDDLNGNAIAFDNALEEWKKLYDRFGLEIQYYSNLEEFENSRRIKVLS